MAAVEISPPLRSHMPQKRPPPKPHDVDPVRVQELEAALREMRSLTAQSPASMSFSNFHSLLMLPDFPRAPVLPQVPSMIPPGTLPDLSHAQGPAAPAAYGSRLASADTAKAANGNGTRADFPVLLAPLPPPIPHNLTPWEELSLRRDSEHRPHRDIYTLTGKRKRKRSAHPSWADGGIGLPLISSKVLGKVEGALRMGTLKVDPQRMVAAGAGHLLGLASPPRSASARSAKRRRQSAGIHIGAPPAAEDEEEEVDDGVLAYLESMPSSQGSSTARSALADGDDSEADSAYESEVDEWEVEVAHTIWQRSQSQVDARPVSERERRGKALAVPLSSNTTLLQVPLSEAERCAWNEEARQQRKLRQAGEAESAASPSQRDPESTLPVPNSVGESGMKVGTGTTAYNTREESGTDELEATLAIASQHMLYELTGGSEA